MAARRKFKHSEIETLLSSFSGRVAARNRALLVFGCETGPRIGELLNVKRKDVITADGKMKDSVTFRMTKVGRNRDVPLSAAAKKYLREWLQEMEGIGLYRGDTPVFCTSTAKPITRIYAWEILKKQCKKVGIDNSTIGTHSMRKTFAKIVEKDAEERKAAGADINVLSEVQIALGHASVNSTIKYLKSEDSKPFNAVKSHGEDFYKISEK